MFDGFCHSMHAQKYIRLLFILFLVRIAVSLSFSDGKLRSDSLNYFGLSLNLIEHFTFTAVTPADEEALRGGVTVTEFFEHYDRQPSPYRRLMNYQWLHSLLFIPIILLFKSLYAIIVVNNLLFFGAGYFLFDIVKDKVPLIDLLMGWIIFLFFPPFFYLTNQFYSEPLFLFFLAVIIHSIVLKKRAGAIVILSLILLPVTRGFGLLFIAGCIAMLVWEKEFRSAAIYALCGFAALGMNQIVGANTRDPETITLWSPPPVIYSVYFTNTVYGNGDNDLFLTYPEKLLEDSAFVAYLREEYSSLDLMEDLVAQNFRNPSASAVTLTNRLGAYFLNVVPDSWNYEQRPNQSTLRRILWSLQNGGVILLLLLGLKKCDSRYRRYFSMLFWVSFTAHMIALSRYRYFQPVLIAGIPAVTAGVARLRELLWRGTKKYAPPH